MERQIQLAAQLKLGIISALTLAASQAINRKSF
jgi:hypothetical protein